MAQQYDSVPNIFYALAQPVLRVGLSHLLDPQQASPHGEAETFAELLTTLKDGKAGDTGLIVLGLDLPGLHGARGICALRAAGIETPILAFSLARDAGEFISVMAAGAGGIVLGDASAAELRKAASLVAGGKPHIPVLDEKEPETVDHGVDPEEMRARLSRLTKRQREVLALIGQGMSNKEIARQLDLSEATIKVHNYAIFNALGVRRRIQALAVLGGSALQNDILLWLSSL